MNTERINVRRQLIEDQLYEVEVLLEKAVTHHDIKEFNKKLSRLQKELRKIDKKLNNEKTSK